LAVLRRIESPRRFEIPAGWFGGNITIAPQEYAAKITPGDAKSLVQKLIRLYSTYPDRL
jgi:hypothetical protein